MKRMLYAVYRTLGTVRFFFSRRVLPLGWGMVIALVAGMVMMMGSPMRPLYQLSGVLMGVVGVSAVWAYSRRGRIMVEREVAGNATAGVAFQYGIVVENCGGAMSAAKVREVCADPRPDFKSFLHAREPGEGQRNIFDRTFAFYRWLWLVERGTLFESEESAIFSLGKKEKRKIIGTITPTRRGVLEMDDVRLLLPDPMGLFQRAKRMSCSKNRICVFPKRFAVPPLRMLGMSRYQVGEDAASRQSGQGGEFASLREYRNGDSPRMMHWPSWAKTGRPIVKEVEDMIFPRYALVLDTFGEAGSEESFEDVVSVAASFASAADTEDCMLDLMFLGDRDSVVSAGRGVAPAGILLEALASVKMGYEEGFDGLSRMILQHGKVLTGCLCVFHGWSESREIFLRRLIAAGIPCRGFALVNHDDESQTQSPVDFLKSGAIAQGLRQLR
jgi:uncharacterized protein (DUF58 family)